MGDRLAYLLRLERRIAHVHVRHDAAVVDAIAVLENRDVLVLPQIRDGGGWQSVDADVVDLASFEREHARGRVGNELRHHAVEVGLVLHVVIRIALHDDVAAARPLFEDERAGADRVPVVALVLARVAALVDVLRVNPLVHQRPREECRERVFHSHDQRGLVGRLDLVDGREAGRCDRIVLHVDLDQRPAHVLGGQRSAVVPLDVPADLERVGHAVRRHVPRLREVAGHFAPGVGSDQLAEQLRRDLLGAEVGRDRDVEMRRIAAERVNQRAALPRSILRAGGRRRRGGQTGHQNGCGDQLRDVWHPVPPSFQRVQGHCRLDTASRVYPTCGA